jgi:hypothetical protein
MRTRYLPFAAAILALAASASVASGQPTDLLTSRQARDLVVAARTPDDHMKLSRHFTALAAKYDADATEHRELAAAYRKAPTASETKRPGTPDTAAHCERFAKAAADAAREARALATEHERMAAKR